MKRALHATSNLLPGPFTHSEGMSYAGRLGGLNQRQALWVQGVRERPSRGARRDARALHTARSPQSWKVPAKPGACPVGRCIKRYQLAVQIIFISLWWIFRFQFVHFIDFKIISFTPLAFGIITHHMTWNNCFFTNILFSKFTCFSLYLFMYIAMLQNMGNTLQSNLRPMNRRSSLGNS